MNYNTCMVTKQAVAFALLCLRAEKKKLIVNLLLAYLAAELFRLTIVFIIITLLFETVVSS